MFNAHLTSSRNQRGIVLLIALLALVALSIGAISLVRSVDTSVVMAGNISFKQSSLRVADIAVEKALEVLAPLGSVDSMTGSYASGWVDSGGKGSTCDWTTRADCQYYPKMLTTDFTSASKAQTSPSPSLCDHKSISATAFPADVPVCAMWLGTGKTTIAWSSLPSYDHSKDANIPQGYSVRYLVDRLCSPLSAESSTWDAAVYPADFTQSPPASTDMIEKYCRTTDPKNQVIGSRAADHVLFSANARPVLYRVTVEVTGPRQAKTYTQTVISQ